MLDLATSVAAHVQVPPFPLTAATVRGVAAALLAAGYRSADDYLGELRRMQLEEGFDVPNSLMRVFDLCKAAVTRGLGPPARAA